MFTFKLPFKNAMTFPATLFLLRLPCETNLASNLARCPGKSSGALYQGAYPNYVSMKAYPPCAKSANPSTASLVFWLGHLGHWNSSIMFVLVTTSSCSWRFCSMIYFTKSLIIAGMVIQQTVWSSAANDQIKPLWTSGNPTIKEDPFAGDSRRGFPHLCKSLPQGNDCCFLHAFFNTHLLFHRGIHNCLIDVGSIDGLISLIVDRCWSMLIDLSEHLLYCNSGLSTYSSMVNGNLK